MTKNYVEGYITLTNTMGIQLRIYDEGTSDYTYSYRYNNEEWEHSENEIEYDFEGRAFVRIYNTEYYLDEIIRSDY